MNNYKKTDIENFYCDKTYAVEAVLNEKRPS